MRGQTGLGIFKLLLSLLGWIPLGIGTFAVWVWVIVDWIIAMIKAYGSAYGQDENLTFDEDGNYIKQIGRFMRALKCIVEEMRDRTTCEL